MTRTITVDHLTRVEGHGGIVVELEGKRIKRVDYNVFEGIRLFEGFIRGRRLEEVTAITSRICAICSHNHAITSLQALEKALGVKVSSQTRKLRDLAFQGSMIESHPLHLFLLALPDFVGHPSVISLAGVNPDAVKLALRLKKLGNTIQEVIGGRAVHPVNYVVGGFGKLPSTEDLLLLKQELETGLKDCEQAVDVVCGIDVPNFVNESIRCAALVPEDDGFFFGNQVRLSSGERIPVDEYRKLTNERCVPHSHAKHSAHNGKSYMVGSLARLTLHGDKITTDLARRAWKKLGLIVPSTNILMNSVAQLIEAIFCVEHAYELVNWFLQAGVVPEQPAPYKVHAGQGAAACEVPRGTLFYWYELDSEGRVVGADIITPTAQNFNNAEDQMRATVRDGANQPDEVLKRRLEMVARAYDPCISCSVHLLRAG